MTPASRRLAAAVQRGRGAIVFEGAAPIGTNVEITAADSHG